METNIMNISSKNASENWIKRFLRCRREHSDREYIQRRYSMKIGETTNQKNETFIDPTATTWQTFYLNRIEKHLKKSEIVSGQNRLWLDFPLKSDWTHVGTEFLFCFFFSSKAELCIAYNESGKRAQKRT